MPLVEGRDYVFCPKATYVGSAGVGEGCLVGTRRRLLMVPLKVDVVVWNRSVTTTTYSLGDEPINQGIARVLASGDLDLDGLEAFMAKIASEIDGCELGHLDEAKRVRVRAGWFSRGIYHSQREKGPGWKGFPLKGKAMAQSWVAFYKALPNFVA